MGLNSPPFSNSMPLILRTVGGRTWAGTSTTSSDGHGHKHSHVWKGANMELRHGHGDAHSEQPMAWRALHVTEPAPHRAESGKREVLHEKELRHALRSCAKGALQRQEQATEAPWRRKQ